MKFSLMIRHGFVLGIAILAVSCSRESMKNHMMPDSVPVTVAMAVQKDVPIQIHTIGNVEAYSTVSVRAQVEGELLRTYFKEGQEVKKGDILFVIDPRPLRALLRQYEANLARDIAQMKKAEADARRNEELFKSGVVSKQEYDRYWTEFEALKETVKADEAAVVNAKLQLGYCYIRSPIHGRVGKLFVNSGNIVEANNTILVTINQTKPIYVAFYLPEQNLLKIREHMAQGNIKVEAIIPHNGMKPIEGELTFINNEVNNSTGTILLKAVFANADELLWPRQFVKVAITLTVRHNAVVAPAQAVQTGQDGKYIFIVKADSTVEYRPVVLGNSFEQETVIIEGLQPGEKIVTNGQLQIIHGSKVEIKGNLERWAQNGSGMGNQVISP